MTLEGFAGIFSRYYVIGFFVPAFFAIFLCSLVAPDSFPGDYHDASGTAQVAIIGGVALLGGLILSGLHYHVTRFFEGYPLRRLKGKMAIGMLHDRLLKHWQDEFDRRTRVLNGPKSDARTTAAQELGRCFPARREKILPTRFGNAVRSFETHGRKRYGLDGISSWPRIAMLLDDAEREQVTDAQTDVAFFLNVSVLAVAAAAFLVVDKLVHPAESTAGTALLMAVIIISGTVVYWGSYRASTAAAMRWGSPVRAAFDLHRLELYDQLGLVQPADQQHEESIARAASRLLLYGEPIPDAYRQPPKPTKETT